jgi:hypothetical protein
MIDDLNHGRQKAEDLYCSAFANTSDYAKSYAGLVGGQVTRDKGGK